MAKGHKTGGRVKGTPNKATRDIKELARALAPEATKRLSELLRSDNDSVALGAVKEIYDRAFGKATQHVAGDPEGSPLHMLHEIVIRGVRPDANDRSAR